jgi:hypothetical protein
MSLSATAKWILLALVGLAIAIAIAAANLTSQQIGIASESVSAGDALAPALKVPDEGKPRGEGGDHSGPGKEGTTTIPSTPTTTTTEEPPPPEETTGPDDHGGESGGSDSDGDDD